MKNEITEEEELRQLGEEARSAKTNWLKLDDGVTHKVRILPGCYGKSGKLWIVKVQQHWVSKDGKRFPVNCPKDATGSCPFCDKVEELRKEQEELKLKIKDPEFRDKAEVLKKKLELVANKIKALYANTNYLANVHSRRDGAPPVEVMTCSKNLFGNIFAIYSDDGGPELLDVHDGYDWRITVNKSGARKDYNVSTVKKSEPLASDDAKIQDILDKRYNLDELATTFIDDAKMQEHLELVLDRVESKKNDKPLKKYSPDSHFDDEDAGGDDDDDGKEEASKKEEPKKSRMSALMDDEDA